MEKKDVIIIGAGVTGCAIARELAAWKLDVLVLEKEEDVCSGTSKANSAIVHAGFDAKTGSLKARFNIEGSRRMEVLAGELDFAYRKNGAFVLCFSEEERGQVQELYDRGIKNGLTAGDLEILSGDEARALEPALSDEVVCALYAKSSAIVCPFELTCALAENAVKNGTEFRFLSEVTAITREGADGFVVELAGKERVAARFVVNAAGVFADKIHNLVSGKKLSIQPRKGDYLLMDKEVGGTVDRTIFQLPGKLGKGVLVTPTVHGNLLAGPTAEDVDDPENTATTAEALADVQARAGRSVKAMPFRQVITSFTGLRAHEAGGDFVIGPCADAPGFYDAAGIESPGLTAAPAIGLYLAGEIAKAAGAERRTDFDGTRKAIPHVALMTDEERAALIRQDADYAQIVCRCETVTEGEIRESIRRNPGARSMDGVKRRVRAGMGRCQAGFCTPRVMEILSEELGIPMEEVCKNRPGSELLCTASADEGGVS
ncbi:MAG: NAD(P)/FAD-dependent oxidoreductase [Lachnospiraceae bacterium]|nr:NAD(P)/FAD-dependent oxidoreductase [Lachnospiraceae bacterium]